MEGSNRVEPLMRHENELNIRPLSVMAGAQSNNHRVITNDTRYGPKRVKCNSPLKTKALVASWINFDDSKLLEFLPLLLKWSGGGRAWW